MTTLSGESPWAPAPEQSPELAANPWLAAPAPAALAPVVPAAVAVAGAIAAPALEDQLGVLATSSTPALWVVGAHGGAGESTLAAILGGSPSAHRWPQVAGERPPVLLCARTHPAGLARAELAMAAWASGSTPPVRLLGLALVADAPGRLPRWIRDRTKVLAGGVPRVWHLPWSEPLRFGEYEAAGKAADQLRAEIGAALLTTR